MTRMTDDGRPKTVDFTFERELEDASLRWVRYEDGDFVPFDLPEVGEAIVLDAVSFSFFQPPES